MEDNLANLGRWDIGVNDTLVQLLRDQRTLQDKLSDMEGCFRCNHSRIYGIPQGVKGSNVATFVENLITTELGDIGSERDQNLGIEHAHRAGLKPPDIAPPRLLVVQFLRFTVKEKVLHTAWSKEPRVQNKWVYFDHYYADDVQKKEEGICAHEESFEGEGIAVQDPDV